MNIGERIRYLTFWFLDFLKGGKVKRHYNDIKNILENYNSSESKSKRDEYLLDLLNHATKNSPYYKKYSNFTSINEFPVVDKAMLRDLEKFTAKNYSSKKSFEISTSGSTGTPFVVLQNKNKRARNTADTLYFGERGGYKLGSKLFYIRAWGGVLNKSKLLSFLQNVKTIKSNGLNEKALENLMSEITKDKSRKSFIGYASSFRDLCKYLDSINSKSLHINVISMIANAEALGKQTKKSIKKYFGVDILSRYSNMENGILSQQVINGGDKFFINWASYFIEILDINEDVPVKHGEMGRVVVTDLFNYHMPMIRYDTGDLAIIDKENITSAPAFFKIEGRRMDTIYNTSGKPVTYAVYDLEYFPEAKQFQLIQEDVKTYLVKLNIDTVFNKENELKEVMCNALGEDAIIKVEYVDEIPLLSSGKRKLTISNLGKY